MHKSKLLAPNESKLSKTLAKFSENLPQEKTGFLTNHSDKTIYFKTKSFRLRQADFINLSSIVTEINKESSRKNYSDSEVIRGMINYISDGLEQHAKKLTKYIKDSS